MDRTHLRRPTSRGSLFQWSVADRTVAACGTGPIGEQPHSGLALTAQIADDRGRFPDRHDRRPMMRKVLSRQTFTMCSRSRSGRCRKKTTFCAIPTLIGLDSRRTHIASWPHPDRVHRTFALNRTVPACPGNRMPGRSQRTTTEPASFSADVKLPGRSVSAEPGMYSSRPLRLSLTTRSEIASSARVRVADRDGDDVAGLPRTRRDRRAWSRSAGRSPGRP